jgi:nitrite reductase/ring-hydroxylating ferredoxin subunit
LSDASFFLIFGISRNANPANQNLAFARTAQPAQNPPFLIWEDDSLLESRCPHQGGPLAEGLVTGTNVVCPLHAWKINWETGGVVNPKRSSALPENISHSFGIRNYPDRTSAAFTRNWRRILWRAALVFCPRRFLAKLAVLNLPMDGKLVK